MVDGIDRRSLLAAAGTLGLAGSSGCLGAIETALGAEEGRRELDATRAEWLIHAEVNDRRERRDLPALAHEPALSDDATAYSRDMARRGFYGHENPEGERVHQRISVNCVDVGENIMRTHWREAVQLEAGTIRIETEADLSEHAVDSWMGSPGHRQNLLNPSFDAQGIGVAADDGDVYLTQVLCGG